MRPSVHLQAPSSMAVGGCGYLSSAIGHSPDHGHSHSHSPQPQLCHSPGNILVVAQTTATATAPNHSPRHIQDHSSDRSAATALPGAWFLTLTLLPPSAPSVSQAGNLPLWASVCLSTGREVM